MLNSIVTQSSVGQEDYQTAAYVAQKERFRVRYRLRYAFRKVTRVKRCQRCGKRLEGSDVRVKEIEGSYYYAGVFYCGAVWLCPVCAPKVRFKRSNEVSRAVLKSIDLGNSNLFVTRTMPHRNFDNLAVLLDDLKECKRFVRQQKDVRALYKRLGFIGDITATEITYGVNGWHPHMHSVELFAFAVSLDDIDLLHQMYLRHARRFYDERGYSKLSAAKGVYIEQVKTGGDALGRYLAKLQEGASLGNEMTRADLKKGRNGSMLPFELLAEFANTGDVDVLNLWYEYEDATKGRSSVRFTPGLRAVLLPNEAEKTDEELANEEVGGIERVAFDGWLYDEILKRQLEGCVLQALNDGGFDAMVGLLMEYNLAHGGGFYQVEQVMRVKIDTS